MRRYLISVLPWIIAFKHPVKICIEKQIFLYRFMQKAEKCEKYRFWLLKCLFSTLFTASKALLFHIKRHFLYSHLSERMGRPTDQSKTSPTDRRLLTRLFRPLQYAAPRISLRLLLQTASKNYQACCYSDGVAIHFYLDIRAGHPDARPRPLQGFGV